jgi:hypothetical protein
MNKSTPHPRTMTGHRSSLPARPKNSAQIAKQHYILETRRQSFLIKKQVAEQKLAKINEELAKLESQLAALGYPVDGAISRPTDNPAAPPGFAPFPASAAHDDEPFTLGY